MLLTFLVTFVGALKWPVIFQTGYFFESGGVWGDLEEYCRELVQQGKELYHRSGARGEGKAASAKRKDCSTGKELESYRGAG
jgi:hypothetical protein